MNEGTRLSKKEIRFSDGSDSEYIRIESLECNSNIGHSRETSRRGFYAISNKQQMIDT
jgi:hypothetical protein